MCAAAPAPFPMNPQHSGLQQYLQWSSSRREMAETVLRTRLERPYVGLHLRHGPDWARACQHAKGQHSYMASPQCTLPRGFVTPVCLCVVFVYLYFMLCVCVLCCSIYPQIVSDSLILQRTFVFKTKRWCCRHLYLLFARVAPSPFTSGLTIVLLLMSSTRHGQSNPKSQSLFPTLTMLCLMFKCWPSQMFSLATVSALFHRLLHVRGVPLVSLCPILVFKSLVLEHLIMKDYCSWLILC